MNLRLLFLPILLLAGLSYSFSQINLTSGLVAHYPFNGNAQDASGNNHHGTVFGAVLTTDRFGIANRAYQFDGVNDVINFATSPLFQPQLPATITAWVYLDAIGGNSVFTNCYFEDTYHGLFMTNSSGYFSTAYCDGGPSGPGSRRSKTGNSYFFNTGRWYHMAAIIRGAFDMSIYIDGIEECGAYSGTGGPIGYNNSPGAAGIIDSNTGLPPFFYHGKIDELRLYNRALNYQEILALQDTPPVPVTADTTICSGGTVTLDAGMDYFTSWTSSTGSVPCTNCRVINVSPTTTTTYTVFRGLSPTCTETQTVTVTVGGPVVNNVTINSAGCGSTSTTFSLNAFSPAGGVNYTILGGPSSTTGVFTGLPAGTYTVRVQDAAGCFVDTTLVVPPVLNAVFAQATPTFPRCNGFQDGAIQVSASGGDGVYQYALNGGPFSATSLFQQLTAGTYQIVVRDGQGCTDTLVVTLSEPDAIVVTTDSVRNTSCFNGMDGYLAFSATGGTPPYSGFSNGITYQPPFVLDSLTQGNYTVVVIDTIGCQGFLTFQITGPNQLQATPLAISPVRCFGGSDGRVTLNISGGTSPYSTGLAGGPFFPGNAVNQLSAGNYSIQSVDANGCVLFVPVTVTEPSQSRIDTFFVDPVNCTGPNSGSVILVANGGTPGYTYGLDSVNQQTGSVISGLSEGISRFWLRDGNGCLSFRDIQIPLALPVAVSAEITSSRGGFAVSCFGDSTGSARATGSGGTGPYQFFWSNGSNGPNVSSLPAGSVRVVAVDQKGCRDTADLVLNQPEELIATANPDTAYNGFNVRCFGGNDGIGSAVASGGIQPYQFLWSNGLTTPVIRNLAAGSYSAQITDSLGCLASAVMVLTQPDSLTVSMEPTHPLCTGQSNGRIQAFGSGGVSPYRYNWLLFPDSTGTSLSGLAAGLYQVTLSDQNGCTTTRREAVIDPAPLVLRLDSTRLSVCLGPSGSAFVTASGGTGTDYLFQWDGLSTTSVGVNRTLSPGPHVVQVSDLNGCTTSLSFQIDSGPSPTAEFVVNGRDITEPIFNYEANLWFLNYSENAPGGYLWNFGDGSDPVPFVNPTHQFEPGEYLIVLTAFDQDSVCPDRDSLFLVVLEEGQIFFPSGFSPNSDSFNDEWTAPGRLISAIDLQIYSRWGMLIQAFDQHPFAWDGKDGSGKDCPEGVYTYKAAVTMNSGRIFRFSGTITLMR